MKFSHALRRGWTWKTLCKVKKSWTQKTTWYFMISLIWTIQNKFTEIESRLVLAGSEGRGHLEWLPNGWGSPLRVMRMFWNYKWWFTILGMYSVSLMVNFVLHILPQKSVHFYLFVCLFINCANRKKTHFGIISLSVIEKQTT